MQVYKYYHYCLISSFYIKPQPTLTSGSRSANCLISSFYIKPQPVLRRIIFKLIVLYRLSTSNHNQCWIIVFVIQLSYIVFLHQTTTVETTPMWRANCLISSFYIKPQHFDKTTYGVGDCLISSFYIKPQRNRFCK